MPEISFWVALALCKFVSSCLTLPWPSTTCGPMRFLALLVQPDFFSSSVAVPTLCNDTKHIKSLQCAMEFKSCRTCYCASHKWPVDSRILVGQSKPKLDIQDRQSNRTMSKETREISEKRLKVLTQCTQAGYFFQDSLILLQSRSEQLVSFNSDPYIEPYN